MKKHLLLLSMLMSFASAVFAQIPTVMMYQVQVRHGESGAKDVKIEMQLRKSQNGAAIWNQVFEFTEMKNYTTVNLALDLGDKFDWNDGEYWLATIIDGKEMGCAQLTSVPYAYSAKTAETAKYIDGALTAEELIGKWSFKNEKYQVEYEFNIDGTYTYATKDYNYTTHVFETYSTHTGKWKLNGAGNLCRYRYYDDGSLKSNNVHSTYFDRENGVLTLSDTEPLTKE